jgi:hypothetical protein
LEEHLKIIKKAKIEDKNDIRTLELKNWLKHIKR